MENFFDIYWRIKAFDKYRGKFEIHRRFLKSRELADSERPSEFYNFLLSAARNAVSVLDYGAGDLRLKKFILANGFTGIYRTFDIGPEYEYDYRHVEDIDASFDLIFCLEVIEHMELEKAVEMIAFLIKKLKDNGRLILTTPNIHHINHFWKTDVTHIRPYPYENLIAIMLDAGFSHVDLYRIVQWKGGVMYPVKFFFKRILCNILEADCATNIALVCRGGMRKTG